MEQERAAAVVEAAPAERGLEAQRPQPGSFLVRRADERKLATIDLADRGRTACWSRRSSAASRTRTTAKKRDSDLATNGDFSWPRTASSDYIARELYRQFPQSMTPLTSP